MTNYTTESKETPQRPPYAQITAFLGATMQATISPSPTIENIYNIIDFIYLSHLCNKYIYICD